MSKTVQNARSFFKNSVQTENDFIEGFQTKTSIQVPSIAIPISIELSEQEQRSIQKILVEDYIPSNFSEEEVLEHVEKLTNITKQIKCIAAQSVLLHGERIKQAQELLAKYREGAFTKWLMNTYGNRQTPYSMLRYYEFYQSAPKPAQLMIEAAPKKAVYMLASRDGDQAKKLQLIQEHGRSTQAELMMLIQSTFPIDKADKRKPINSSTINAISKLCEKLEKRHQHLSISDKTELKNAIQRLQNLL